MLLYHPAGRVAWENLSWNVKGNMLESWNSLPKTYYAIG